MKKFYMLMGVAVTAVSAIAMSAQPLEKEEVGELQKASVENVKMMSNDAAVLNTVSLSTRAGQTVGEPKIQSPVDIFFMGLQKSGSYYATSLGLTPSWGKLKFSAIAEGATSYNWTWHNGWVETYERYRSYSVDGQNLEIDLIPGIDGCIFDLLLTASNSDNQSLAQPFTGRYFTGGSFGYYSTNYADCGATMYPCLYYKEDDKYMGTSVGFMSLDKTPASSANYDSNGTFKDWTTGLVAMNKDSQASDFSDIVVEGFGYVIPAMSSPYILSGMNIWANATFSAATTLQGGIYEIKNNAISEKPIAKITANVAAGSPSDNIEFEFIAVDEDGDEIEDELIIDNQEIVIKIEGLNKNNAIQKFTPVYGNGTIWSAADRANSPWYHNSLISLEYKNKGVAQNYFGNCPYNYWVDDAKTQLFFTANFLWNLYVNFPFVENAKTMGRDFNVEIPVAGGNATVDITSTWNLGVIIQREKMEVTADANWVKCSIGAADEQTGIQQITVEGEPLPSGVEGRRAKISFKGMGADFTIDVTQGNAPAGVNDIVVDVDAEAVYYDLQGRKVVGTPDKGVYIVKKGNKVSKVIL